MTHTPQYIIRVQELGKQYRLGGSHAKPLRDLINGFVGGFFAKRNGSAEKKAQESKGGSDRVTDRGYFAALKDVSFDVRPGEVVGIIGKNGAGKSTLLKILSSIISPTAGRVELFGRVASLLEVGTGFHPELTGRENVFLNGTILGMSRAEVRRRFDEIVAFSGVEQFIDTPIKRYSSGMTVRLAFAVAAHLESEILIVDEVLAVGDIEFQRKCIDRMQTATATGRTVLFVSHNMQSVRALTARSVVLSNGSLIFDGPTNEAIEYYAESNCDVRSMSADVSSQGRPFKGLTEQLRLMSLQHNETTTYVEGDRVVVNVCVRNYSTVGEYTFGLTVCRHDDTPIGNTFSPPVPAPQPGHDHTVRLVLPTVQLAPGRYHCSISLGETRSSSKVLYDSLSNVLHFSIEHEQLSSHAWLDGWGSIRFDGIVVSCVS